MTLSTTDPSFQREVTDVLHEIGEIACVIRFSRSAGSRSYEFFGDIDSFRYRLRQLPAETSVIVFRDPQFPYRGIVDEAFLAKVKSELSGRHWTVARTSLITMGSQSWYHNIDGDKVEELEEELRSEYCWEHPVAVGEEPDWHSLERTLEAVIPNEYGEHGQARKGIY